MRLMELSDKKFNTGPNHKSVTLYYGTCRGRALSLDRGGFNPQRLIGDKHIVLVSTVELAKKQALDSKCDAIVKVSKVSVNSIMPLKYAPMDNSNSRQDMVDAIDAGEDVAVRLVKQHSGAHFEYINKLRKRPRK